MEIWDLYYEDGTPSGREMVRGEPVPAGLYHLACEVLVRHRDGDYLLMRRSASKPNFPHFWEATAGGSALRGEDPLTCIRRELWEETGIRGEAFTLLDRKAVRGDTLFYCYLCETDWDKAAVQLREGETDAFRWVSEEAFGAFLNSGSVIPPQYARWESWYRRMGYVK